MGIEGLAGALEREHREIDEGIAAFTAGLRSGNHDRQSVNRAVRALRRHIYLEEEFLFPLLCGANAGLAAPVFVMLREHGQLWQTLDALERELDASIDGADSASELKLCRQLAVQLLHHNLKEQKILYPVADELLTASAAARLRALFGSAELPDSWVCAKAGSAPVLRPSADRSAPARPQAPAPGSPS